MPLNFMFIPLCEDKRKGKSFFFGHFDIYKNFIKKFIIKSVQDKSILTLITSKIDRGN